MLCDYLKMKSIKSKQSLIDLLLDHVQEGLVDSSEIDNPHFQ